MTRTLFTAILCTAALIGKAQHLVDSIPYPGVAQAFWGIHVTPDTIYLGADFSGDIYFSDHNGTIMGQQSTGFSFNHGLIRRPNSYLIAQDYTTNGAHLYEVSLNGTLLNTWTFPDVLGGHSSGIGGIHADGEAVWYTMYYPDFDVYPYAYAYKWIPGDAAPIDTVPLLGAQPQGIALKGDTLLYVMDDNDDDAERIYAYDLANSSDIGYVDLPDMATDGDQSPRGLFWDGEFLYLVANRSGSAVSAFQTIFIYSFDAGTGFTETTSRPFQLMPNPTDAQATIIVSPDIMRAELYSSTGTLVGSHRPIADRIVLRTDEWPAGVYTVRLVEREGGSRTQRLVVQH